MPLPNYHIDTIKCIQKYCQKDLDSHSQHIRTFDFIESQDLQERLSVEFYIARYIAKLQEALALKKNSYELIGHLKMQIVQYAGIYEAVISYLLKEKFAEHKSVSSLGQKIEYKPVSALAEGISIQKQDETLYLCNKTIIKSSWIYINFEDKLKAAVEIGLISEETKIIVLDIYKLRHSVHIEKVVKDDIEFEIEQCRTAFRTLVSKFLKEIREFLKAVETPELKQEEQEIISELEKDLSFVETEASENTVNLT